MRNIVALAEKHKINPKILHFIDKKLKKTILPYMKARYPLNADKDVNKSLQSAIRPIDNLQIVKNDYLYSSEVVF